MTAAQQRVLDAVKARRGVTVRELAAELKLSTGTVNRHLRALYKADAVHWRAESRGKLGQSVYVWYVGKWPSA